MSDTNNDVMHGVSLTLPRAAEAELLLDAARASPELSRYIDLYILDKTLSPVAPVCSYRVRGVDGSCSGAARIS